MFINRWTNHHVIASNYIKVQIDRQPVLQLGRPLLGAENRVRQPFALVWAGNRERKI